MKNIYLTFSFAMLTVFMSQAQNIELHHESNPIGSTFSIDSVSSSSSFSYFLLDLYIVNKTTETHQIIFNRTRWHNTNGWSDDICDNLICFTPEDEKYWYRPTTPALNIPAGDSSLFQLKVYHNDINGCGIYTYNVTTMLGTILDSIQVTYTMDGNNCFLSVDQPEKKVSYSVYPNPATNLLTVDVSNIESNTVLKIYDIVGKEVKSIELINGKNQMDVSNLNSGIYFYTIFKDNKSIIETKKLVIK